MKRDDFGRPEQPAGSDIPTTRLGVLRRARSGRVLGAVAKALGAETPILRDKTAKRFFAGEMVSEDKRRALFEELAGALVDSGVVPASMLLWRADLAVALEHGALRWDRLVATLQSRSAVLHEGGTVIGYALRLLTVDLALRAFALLRLAGAAPPVLGTPLWAEQNGGGRLLRALAAKAGLTRERLAECLDVSENAVDNWLDGNNRPTSRNIEALARVLAPPGEMARVAQDVRRCFAFAQLADLLVPSIGRKRIVELATACCRFVRGIGEDVARMDRSPLSETTVAAELFAVMFGTAHPATSPLLSNLARKEPDDDWRRDILVAAAPWHVGLEAAAARAVGPRMAGLAQDPEEIVVQESAARQTLLAADRAAEVALAEEAASLDSASHPSDAAAARRDLVARVDRLRAIARDHPTSPKAHFAAGSFMGMAGKWLRRRDLVSEGVAECRIAAALLPGWDAPLVEPGIMLANIGDFEATLRELAAARERLPAATPHLQFATGYVLMNLSRHTDALAQFERVIAVSPAYALALRWGAHCAFRVGDRRKGLRLAKLALRFGEPDEYLAWWTGRYGNREGQARQKPWLSGATSVSGG